MKVQTMMPLTTRTVQKMTVSTASSCAVSAFDRISSSTPAKTELGRAVAMKNTDSREIRTEKTRRGRIRRRADTHIAPNVACGLQLSRHDASSVQHSEQIGPA